MYVDACAGTIRKQKSLRITFGAGIIKKKKPKKNVETSILLMYKNNYMKFEGNVVIRKFDQRDHIRYHHLEKISYKKINKKYPAV